MATETPTPVLECIEGRDDFLLIPIPINTALLIGNDSNGASSNPIKELKPDEGTLSFQWDGFRLFMDPKLVWN